jgi:DNA-directed RNA polymerase specialized sigma24 family protein
MHQMPPIVDKRILRPAQTALSLELLNKMDLLPIKTIARIYARGLPPDGVWEDMLQEALTLVLTGSRRQPEGVPMVAFVAGILRSLRADYWRRAKRESSDDKLRFDRQRDESLELDLADPTPGPERLMRILDALAQEAIDAIGSAGPQPRESVPESDLFRAHARAQRTRARCRRRPILWRKLCLPKSRPA